MTTITTSPFPSTQWFEDVARVAGRDEERFRKLGFIDIAVGLQVLPGEGLIRERTFLLTFGAYSLEGVREADSLAGADFSLSAPYGVWKEMIGNIKANPGADLRHTLNYLNFGQLELKAADQLRADLFFRVNGSLQAFFDCASELETEFVA